MRIINTIVWSLIPILICSLSSARGANRSEQPSQSAELVDRLSLTLMSDNKPFTLITRIYLKPGTEAQFEPIAIRVSKASSAEKGCLAYEFHRDLEKPTNYTLIEKWTGLAPLRSHLLLDHTKQIQTAFSKMSTTPRTTEIFAPVGSK
jgi:quinol monooxygenase YgiN